jgi:hypothetical protein
MSCSSHAGSVVRSRRLTRMDFSGPVMILILRGLIPAKMQLKYFLICAFVTGRHGKES